MLNDWALLSPRLQTALANDALRQAIETVAIQAETLAGEMEIGGIADHGGADALRLLAAVVRVTSQGEAWNAGCASNCQ